MGRKWEIEYNYNSKKYGKITILEFIDYTNCTIQFDDGVILHNINYGNLKKDLVRNNNALTVFGVGYIGYGNYTVKLNKIIYNPWWAMLKRAYTSVYATYKDVTVCEEWKCFQNFAKWHEENFKPHMQGWHLDKDILIKGNKIYSSATCCLVPPQINSLFVKADSIRGKYPIGVSFNKINNNYNTHIFKYNKRKYLGTFGTPEEAFECYKFHKEAYIKEVADEWKPLIEPIVYTAMYNYKIEITD